MILMQPEIQTGVLYAANIWASSCSKNETIILYLSSVHTPTHSFILKQFLRNKKIKQVQLQFLITKNTENLTIITPIYENYLFDNMLL